MRVGTMRLTFSTKILIIRTALAICLTIWVAVTLPPSCEGLEAAAFTGKLYPEQNKTLQITECAASPTFWSPFPTWEPTRVPEVYFWVFRLEFWEQVVFRVEKSRKKYDDSEKLYLPSKAPRDTPVLSQSFHICTMGRGEPFAWKPSTLHLAPPLCNRCLLKELSDLTTISQRAGLT